LVGWFVGWAGHNIGSSVELSSSVVGLGLVDGSAAPQVVSVPVMKRLSRKHLCQIEPNFLVGSTEGIRRLVHLPLVSCSHSTCHSFALPVRGAVEGELPVPAKAPCSPVFALVLTDCGI
jgi:hypothetical protein